MEMKTVFINNERLEFGTHETYNRIREDGAESDIGDYELTIRAISDGFISRGIVGDHGVLLTSDSLHIVNCEEVAVSLRKMLAEHT
ncbi:DUF7522 family protein [Haladaptatus pallidirubidus]|uniref:Uncharacterized protein n=3 Tax=Haladaptatus pallidirubidus TaxID=1008152 RepID=A0AAV3UCT2_9EURY